MVSSIGKAKQGRGKSIYTNKHREPIVSLIDKIINEADVIIEVLDSRFIEKTRNIEAEKKVKKLGKSLIYIFNKADLVNIDKIKQEKDFSELKPGLFFSSLERKGANRLKNLIKIQASKIKKENVNIGIIGYPNSGKSSLINLLIGRMVARTSSEAGYTKGLQKVKIATSVYLIDTPGIIPPLEKKTKNDFVTKHSQIGAVTWDKIKDPEMVVFNLMREYPGLMEKHYNLNVEGNSEELIEQLGRKWNYLKKGNEVDEKRTSKQILRDWQEGKIRIN